MRVYLPATTARLRGLADTGQLAPEPGTALLAHAVTPALREWYATGDLEELEYAALADAARASLDLLATPAATSAATAADRAAIDRAAHRAAADEPTKTTAATTSLMVPRRVVVVAEVPEAAVRPAPDLGRSAVRLHEPVPLVRVAAVHVDDVAAEGDVRRAVAALPAAREGDADAKFVVDGAEGHELLWYATQELPYLLG